ncbi:MAG: F0F1 ATP synthase subunit B [Saprospiraceae bacterium]
MKINWFTVIAQIINFLILVWLLKRYLYHPILNAIDEREKKIADQLKDAEVRKAEAIKEQDEFRQKNETFDVQKNELMSKVATETNEVRQKLLEEARNEANNLSAKLESASKEEQEKQNSEIAQKIQQEVFAITRKTLADLASISLEEQSINVFIKRLNELKEEEKKQFIATFKSTSNTVLVRSAFDLPENLQKEIQKTIDEILGTKTQLQFKTTPELISGIDLTTNGYKLAWSISEYLQLFEKNISEAIKEKPKAEPKKNQEEKKSAPEKK